MENLSSMWGYFVAIAGGISVIWGFNKTIKEIKAAVAKPLTDLDSKIDTKIAALDSKLEAKIEALETKIDEANNSDKLVKSTLLSMQRSSILDKCEECFEKGFATMEEKETVYHQFESYKELGGNSFVESMVQKLNNLPEHKSTKKTRVKNDTIVE